MFSFLKEIPLKDHVKMFLMTVCVGVITVILERALS